MPVWSPPWPRLWHPHRISPCSPPPGDCEEIDYEIEIPLNASADEESEEEEGIYLSDMELDGSDDE